VDLVTIDKAAFNPRASTLLPTFFLLLFAFQRFTLDDWGFKSNMDEQHRIPPRAHMAI
jgi:hypothetical protein